MDQEKVGGNELPRTEEMVNPVSVLPPELCQKRDGVARKLALSIIFVKQDRYLPTPSFHSPVTSYTLAFIHSRLCALLALGREAA